MSLLGMLPQTVTIVRYDDAALDADRNFVRSETGRADSRARLRQLTTAEPGQGGVGLTDRWRLYLPAGTAISASDEVYESGRMFRVDGSPYAVVGLASAHHVECNLLYVADLEQTPAASAETPVAYPSTSLFPSLTLYPIGA